MGPLAGVGSGVFSRGASRRGCGEDRGLLVAVTSSSAAGVA